MKDTVINACCEKKITFLKISGVTKNARGKNAGVTKNAGTGIKSRNVFLQFDTLSTVVGAVDLSKWSLKYLDKKIKKF